MLSAAPHGSPLHTRCVFQVEGSDSPPPPMSLFPLWELCWFPPSSSSEESESELEADFIWTDFARLDPVSSVSSPSLEDDFFGVFFCFMILTQGSRFPPFSPVPPRFFRGIPLRAGLDGCPNPGNPRPMETVWQRHGNTGGNGNKAREGEEKRGGTGGNGGGGRRWEMERRSWRPSISPPPQVMFSTQDIP